MFVILGVLAGSSHADKPATPPGQSKPEPAPILISITGGIEGQGDAAQMKVTFSDESFGELAGQYVANPDGPLEILGVRKGSRTLRYYYCDACSLDEKDCCDDPTHNPAHYFALVIYGGTLEGKKETERIVFPSGSEWQIRSKEPYGDIFASGNLTMSVIYKELD
jgi:hypothetical protein